MHSYSILKLTSSRQLLYFHSPGAGQLFSLHVVESEDDPEQSVPPFCGPTFDLVRVLLPEPHDLEHELQDPHVLHVQGTEIHYGTECQLFAPLSWSILRKETMNHDFSCCLLDGVQNGVMRKVCPECKFHKMACSMGMWRHRKHFVKSSQRPKPEKDQK